MTPGERARQLVIDAVKRELEAMAHDLLEAAKHDISRSPVTGDPDPAVSLRESGRVGRVQRRGDRWSIAVGFHTVYAAAQHEGHMSYVREGVTGEAAGGRIFWEVKHHPGGGKTKYLERNVKAMAPEFDRRLAEAVRRELAAARLI
jgi:Bacteriophage HK97-gp10, putative tail-component